MAAGYLPGTPESMENSGIIHVPSLSLPDSHRPLNPVSMNERDEAPYFRAAFAPMMQRATYHLQMPHTAH